MRRLLAVSVALAICVALAAGCGGSSDKKANEAYANSVCSAVSTWTQEIKSIATDFSSGVSKASLQQKVDQAETATKKLVTDIKAVPPPETEQGTAAKQQLDQFSSDASATVTAATSAIGGLPDDASAASIATAVATLGPQVQTLVSSGKAAFEALKDAGGSLSDAFKSADACKSLAG